jgi:hypothetical protein
MDAFIKLPRWKELFYALGYLREQEKKYEAEWTAIKTNCKHENLRKRELGEQYYDICPDCGFGSYCYKI